MPVPPVSGVAFDFEVFLISQADTNVAQVNPTLAAGDVTRSLDGGAFANITALPVAIGAGKVLTVSLTAAEMTITDRIAVLFSDVAGAEWQDRLVEIFLDGTPAAVWAHSPRTLTESAASAADAITGTAITRTRCTTWSISITGVGNIAARTDFYFTIKRSTSDDDDEALVMIEETAGLQVINGSTDGVVPGNGSILVTNAVLGNFTVTLAAVETCKLTEEDNVFYGAKQILAASVPTPVTTGRFNIVSIVTEAIT